MTFTKMFIFVVLSVLVRIIVDRRYKKDPAEYEKRMYGTVGAAEMGACVLFVYWCFCLMDSVK